MDLNLSYERVGEELMKNMLSVLKVFVISYSRSRCYWYLTDAVLHVALRCILPRHLQIAFWF